MLPVLITLSALAGATGCHVGAMLAITHSALDQGPYRAETLAAELGPGSVRTLGCLDLGIVLYERNGKDLVDVHVGNRCGYPERLDLGKLAIRGTDPAGNTREVSLYDPKGEVVPLHVGGAQRGRERFRIDDARDMRTVCFDLDRAAPDAPAAHPPPLCFDRPTGFRPTPGTWTTREV